jgi:hypothetical protein
MCRTIRRMRLGVGLLAALLILGSVSCTRDQFLANTVARRGNANFAFLNETPYRAIFSFGLFDPLDQKTQLQFDQLRLEGESFSQVFQLSCQRAISVGSERLLVLAEDQDVQINDNDAFVVGVSFSDTDAEDPLAGRPTVGRADPLTLQLGIDYSCETFVVFIFRQDEQTPSVFHIDWLVMR